MCLATPQKIIKIKDGKATVQSEGHTHEADLSLLKDAEVGEYVLVHGDMVLNRIEENEALKILEIINKGETNIERKR
ncbi:MAG: HypC/HybG/HupF family hydrogenase formation chaperone [Candidatus Marinimicrobia bacterium]|nr:HypC/HybG/HupF family hydrogenase formation chaperone [Candidatus Neomarinimicrobiota bacterium]